MKTADNIGLLLAPLWRRVLSAQLSYKYTMKVQWGTQRQQFKISVLTKKSGELFLLDKRHTEQNKIAA